MRSSTHIHSARSTRGSALIPALFVVMLVAVLAVAYLQLSLNKNREAKTSVDVKRAFYIAEAGLAEGFYGLAAGKSGNVGSAAEPAAFANGVFWVVAEDAGPGKVKLTSNGLCGSGRSSACITLKRGSDSLGSLGVFSDRDVGVSSGAIVDSYDSRTGAYNANGARLIDDSGGVSGARLGSNANVNVAGASGGSLAAVVFGDAQPGVGGSVLRGVGALVTGSTAPRSVAATLPPIDVPSISSAGPLDLAAQGTTTLPGGEHAYDMLHVHAGAALVVSGPATLVLSSLVLDPGARLTLDGSAGAVKVYVSDWMNLAGSSTLNTTGQDTGAVSLLVAARQTTDRNGDGIPDAPVSFNAGGNFYGLMYLPGAVVTLPASFTLYGAISASKLTLAPNAQLHFDRALIDAPASDGSLPQLLSWRLVELPRVPLVDMRFDPVALLKLNGVTPKQSKDSHYDKGDFVDETPYVPILHPQVGQSLNGNN